MSGGIAGLRESGFMIAVHNLQTGELLGYYFGGIPPQPEFSIPCLDNTETVMWHGRLSVDDNRIDILCVERDADVFGLPDFVSLASLERLLRQYPERVRPPSINQKLALQKVRSSRPDCWL